MQASKAPARIDVLAWFCDIDTSVATWTDGTTTPNRLHQLHHQTWTPQHLDLVKAITRRCETWTHTARELLGDNPTVVPLRLPCPKCAQLWHHPPSSEAGRVYALRVSENGAQCLACKTKWISDAETAVFRRMLGLKA